MDGSIMAASRPPAFAHQYKERDSLMSAFLHDLHAMEDRRARHIDQERIAARNLVKAERTVLNATKTAEREARRQVRMAALAGWDAEDDLW
jgi:hypothetical protein